MLLLRKWLVAVSLRVDEAKGQSFEQLPHEFVYERLRRKVFRFYS